MDFLIDRYSHFSPDANPILPDDPFSTEWTREALRAVYAQGVNHIAQVGLSHIPSLWYFKICQGYLLWDALRDWELENLSAVLPDERWALRSRFPPAQVKNCFGRSAAIVEVEDMYLDRLKQCHSSEFLSRA